MSENMDGGYYIKGDVVWKAPKRTKTETGTSINVGFPVCKMTEFVGAEAAQFIADAMNKHEAGHSGCFCPHCNPQ